MITEAGEPYRFDRVSKGRANRGQTKHEATESQDCFSPGREAEPRRRHSYSSPGRGPCWRVVCPTNSLAPAYIYCRRGRLEGKSVHSSGRRKQAYPTANMGGMCKNKYRTIPKDTPASDMFEMWDVIRRKGLEWMVMVNLFMKIWPRFGTDWPRGGSFEPRDISRVRAEINRRSLVKEMPYIMLWEDIS